jgi:hypothetical protein
VLPASVRIFVCTVPQDMRRPSTRWALVTRRLWGEDPQSGASLCLCEQALRARQSALVGETDIVYC